MVSYLMHFCSYLMHFLCWVQWFLAQVMHCCSYLMHFCNGHNGFSPKRCICCIFVHTYAFFVLGTMVSRPSYAFLCQPYVFVQALCSLCHGRRSLEQQVPPHQGDTPYSYYLQRHIISIFCGKLEECPSYTQGYQTSHGQHSRRDLSSNFHGAQDSCIFVLGTMVSRPSYAFLFAPYGFVVLGTMVFICPSLRHPLYRMYREGRHERRHGVRR